MTKFLENYPAETTMSRIDNKIKRQFVKSESLHLFSAVVSNTNFFLGMVLLLTFCTESLAAVEPKNGTTVNVVSAPKLFARIYFCI